MEEFRFAPPATAAGTVALLALEIAFSPVLLERAPSGVEDASDGGVPRRVGVILPRCPEAVAVVAAERPVALPVFREMPFRVERPANPVPLEVTVLRGVAALELWMALDLQGAPWDAPRAAPAPEGMAEDDLGDS